MIPAEAIIATARCLRGVKWKHQGRTLDGLDCIGLLVWVGKFHGLPVRDYVAYSRMPNVNLLYPLLHEVAVPIKRENISLASVVLLSFANPLNAAKPLVHAAFVGDRGRPWSIIHCYADVGHVTENSWDEKFFKFRSAYRLKGVC